MNNTEMYERLGLSKDASAEDIKKAHRKLARKYHPDINKEPGAEEQYKKIQEAYDVLGDEQKKAAYDQYGSTDGNPNPGGFGGFQNGGPNQGFSQFGGDFGDIFSQMFGGAFDPNRPRQGEDLQFRLNLTFDEAIFGKETQIKYRRRTSNDTQEEHEVKVTVPAGIQDGQQLRLQGQGDAGYNGGPNGDLYVIFSVGASDKGFERDGADIYFEQSVSIAQAALGDEIEIPTVHGEVKLKIPAGTQPETEFRLSGKGAPRLGSSGRGDQYVRVSVVIPKKMNSKQTELLKEFDASFSGNESKQKKKGFFG